MRIRPNQPVNTGSALILVLVFIALISSLIWFAQARAQARAQLARDRADQLVLHTALNDAIQHALQLLSDDEDLELDTPRDDWAQPLTLPTPAGLFTEIHITDANRRFDLNNLALQTTGTLGRPVPDIITDLVKACQPRDLAFANQPLWIEALRDAVDADNEGNFEDPDDHRPPNNPLPTRNDLLRVPLIDRSFFLRPRPEPGSREEREAPPHPDDTFTLLPSDRDPRRTANKVNINTAPEHVLRALVPPTPDFAALVTDIVAYRKTNPIRNLSRYADRLPPAALEVANLYLDTRSTHFLLEAKTTHPNGADAKQRLLVHRQPSGTVKIIHWYP